MIFFSQTREMIFLILIFSQSAAIGRVWGREKKCAPARREESERFFFVLFDLQIVWRCAREDGQHSGERLMIDVYE